MRAWLNLSARYKLIAFMSGFALMAFELAGSRILSPIVGSSTYVWTSIIGVIIAALSCGYFFGGWLADTRGRVVDISLLLIGCAGLILVTLIASDTVLFYLGRLTIDVRLQAVTAALILFAPASLLLGALSPYLAKMHTTSIDKTGRSIAALSALNSLGGIVGTFLVGFIFFGFIGSKETLLSLVAILAFSSLLLLGKQHLWGNLKFLLVIMALGAFVLVSSSNDPGVVAKLETPSSSYLIRDLQYKGEPVRALTMGPGGFQSGIFLSGKKDLVFDYTNTIARGIKLHAQPNNILVLGGGTFTMPEYLATIYPRSKVDVVEIDPKLESISKKYFSYSSPKNIEIFPEDARTYVNNTSRSYDVVIIDVFSDTGIPFSVTTKQFATNIRQLLKRDGIMLMNVIAGENPQCRPLLHSIIRSFTGELNSTTLPVSGTDLYSRQNIILAFSKSNTAWLNSLRGKTISTDYAEGLTDNFAPIERLHQNCLNS